MHQHDSNEIGGVCLQKHAFEVASDAFHTFKVLLVQHRDVTTAYLEIPENYDAFFSNFDGLLTSNNYATQRQVSSVLMPPISNWVDNKSSEVTLLWLFLPACIPHLSLKFSLVFTRSCLPKRRPCRCSSLPTTECLRGCLPCITISLSSFT